MELILGKFKSAEELARAYTALETAFTKKCQELAALGARPAREGAATAPDESPDVTASEPAASAPPAEAAADVAPRAAEGLIDADAERFFAAFPAAKPDARDLAELLAAERVVDYTAMLTAYVKLLGRRARSAEEWAGDEEFLAGYIYPSTRVRDYFYAQFADSAAPRLMGAGRGALTAPVRPATLADAAEIARRMLK